MIKCGMKREDSLEAKIKGLINKTSKNENIVSSQPYVLYNPQSVINTHVPISSKNLDGSIPIANFSGSTPIVT